jgi:uncharacterized protein YggU (UPF0235/DUF167 family)
MSNPYEWDESEYDNPAKAVTVHYKDVPYKGETIHCMYHIVDKKIGLDQIMIEVGKTDRKKVVEFLVEYHKLSDNLANDLVNKWFSKAIDKYTKKLAEERANRPEQAEPGNDTYEDNHEIVAQKTDAENEALRNDALAQRLAQKFRVPEPEEIQ